MQETGKKRKGGRSPAEPAQSNALQFRARQEHRQILLHWSKTCMDTGQSHLLMQTNKLSAAVFFQQFLQEKVFLHLCGVSLRALPVQHSLSFLPAGTNSEPCLAACYFTVLTLKHHPGRPWYFLTEHTEVLKWGGPLSVVLSVWNKRTCPQLYHRHNLSHHSVMQTCWAQ